MSEERETGSGALLLVLGAWALGLGVWWAVDGRPDVGGAWFAMAASLLLAWEVRRRTGRTPWWARRVRLADVRSRLRRTTGGSGL